MTSLFYGIVEGILALGVYISHQSLIYSVKVLDLFLMFWPNAMPLFMHTPIYIMNVLALGMVINDIFAPKKTR